MACRLYLNRELIRTKASKAKITKTSKEVKPQLFFKGSTVNRKSSLFL